MTQLDPSFHCDDGKIGYQSDGDIIDASGLDTHLKARGAGYTIYFYDGAGDTGNAINNNGLYLAKNNTTAPSVITVGAALGIKNRNGTKLVEIKSNGSFVTSGSLYTTQSTATYAANSSFDTFDFAEVFPCDALYDVGTVVCPGPNNKLTRCTHDNCPSAMILSNPGYCIGEKDEENFILPIALVGRVRVRTACDIPAGVRVVSDGCGGVRQLTPGEWGSSLGFTLHETSEGMVGIFLRPQFCLG